MNTEKYENFILVSPEIEARFWNKIYDPDPNNPNGCWFWTARRDKDNYGIMAITNPYIRGLGSRCCRAPRLSWILENQQEIPEGMQVQHTCDNPSCCRPSHLKLGDHQDNATDRKQRGRYDTIPKGENHVKAKLTNKLVKQILHLYYHNDVKIMDISRQLMVRRESVSAVVRGKCWTHISKNLVKKYQNQNEKNRHRNLAMWDLKQNGYSNKYIAKHFNLGVEYVRQILRGIKNETK